MVSASLPVNTNKRFSKTGFRFSAFLSFFLNVYYQLSWIIVFNRHTVHEKRVEAFKSLTLHLPVLLFVVLTIASISYYIFYLKDSKVVYGLLAGLQSLFLALFLFSLL